MRVAWLPAILALVACDPASSGSTGTAPSATASPTPSVVASDGPRPPGPSYDEAKLHVPADFEDEAESAITKDNYEERLAELHEEITGEAMEGSGGAKPAPTPAPAPSGSAAP